jgi:GNAT superfamily N-acetyltransferase
MTLVTSTDPARVRDLCAAVVAADPVVGTIFATIADWATREDAAAWAVHPAGAPTQLAARSHADTPVTFTPGWRVDDLAAIVASLRALDPPAASLAGPCELVEAIAPRLGRTETHRTAERLYRLDRLVEPALIAGRARPADPVDIDFLLDWYVDFQREALGRVAPGQGTRTMVHNGITHGRCWLWLDADERARSFAQRRPAANGVSRIGPVYTPPQWRGQGYGSAATAAATRDVLAEGAVPCLYTDLRNATSNKVYQALGYVPVQDRLLVRFG